MESMQSDRLPYSIQPPQRIDTVSSSTTAQTTTPTTENKNVTTDISLAYKRKSLKHRIECDIYISISTSDISELRIILGDRQCSMYKDSLNNTITSCVVCEEPIQNSTGLFAIETVLFIPNKNDPTYDNLGRFRIELPRVACYECSQEYASLNNKNINKLQNKIILSLGNVWKNYKNDPNTINTNNTPQNNQLSNDNNNTQDEKNNNTMDNNNQIINTNDNNAANNNNNNAKTVMPLTESERDPFDDGFLICTQLVKTGGADQGGLQVGDVFVEFGHYSKTRFPGLKSIANLVRRSASKEINVVVWRKLEQMNAIEDDGTGRTVFQKLALKLKPLQSHDADGGGVLGAVINTYPLPEMKN
eukprot:437484_1